MSTLAPSVALALAAAGSAAGCRGDDREPVARTTPGTTARTVVATVASTRAPDADPPSAATFTTVAVGTDPGSQWCGAFASIEAHTERLEDDLDLTDPGELRDGVGGLVGALDEARSVAPPPIADAVETAHDGFTGVAAAFAAADWVLLDADLSHLEELDVEMDAAYTRIRDYSGEVCGIADDDDRDESGGGFDPGAGTAREQMVGGLVELGFTEEEAGCIVANVDLGAFLRSDDDALVIEAFEACDISLDRLAELGDL